MKSTIITMFIVLIVLMTVPALLYYNDDLAKKFGFGSTANSADDRAKTPKNIKAVVTDKKIDVYKWVDKHGVMQFSSTPPFEGGGFEMMELSPTTNVIDAYKAPKKEQEEASNPEVFNVGSPYSPGGMKEIVDESQNVRDKLNQRQAEQEKILQDLLEQSN